MDSFPPCNFDRSHLDREEHHSPWGVIPHVRLYGYVRGISMIRLALPTLKDRILFVDGTTTIIPFLAARKLGIWKN